MRINALQRDVIRRHVGPFLFCSATILFLLLMQFLILYLDKIIGKGLPFWVILELILMQVPSMVVLAVPMSVLVPVRWPDPRLESTGCSGRPEPRALGRPLSSPSALAARCGPRSSTRCRIRRQLPDRPRSAQGCCGTDA
ncbi:MAG: hypothetical protein RIS24_2540 [Verrucomicrobiota bacterium]